MRRECERIRLRLIAMRTHSRFTVATARYSIKLYTCWRLELSHRIAGECICIAACALLQIVLREPHRHQVCSALLTVCAIQSMVLWVFSGVFQINQTYKNGKLIAGGRCHPNSRTRSLASVVQGMGKTLRAALPYSSLFQAASGRRAPTYMTRCARRHETVCGDTCSCVILAVLSYVSALRHVFTCCCMAALACTRSLPA